VNRRGNAGDLQGCEGRNGGGGERLKVLGRLRGGRRGGGRGEGVKSGGRGRGGGRGGMDDG